MVYDIFTFCYELELLELRLNILNDYVDKFVIIEATETFMGESKRLYFQENKHRFDKWKHKIIHYVIDDYPNDKELYEMAKRSPNVGAGEHWWVREFYQKESIKKALVGLNDDDVCYVSDIDEIWRPNLNIDFTQADMFRPRQTSYLYYLNNRTDGIDLWTGTIVVRYKTIKESCLNHLRTRSMTQYKVIENGGWHYEAFGGKQGALIKMNICKHPDYYQQHHRDYMTQRIENNMDYKGRNLRLFIDNSDLPDYVNDHKDQYKHFFK